MSDVVATIVDGGKKKGKKSKGTDYTPFLVGGAALLALYLYNKQAPTEPQPSPVSTPAPPPAPVPDTTTTDQRYNPCRLTSSYPPPPIPPSQNARTVSRLSQGAPTGDDGPPYAVVGAPGTMLPPTSPIVAPVSPAVTAGPASLAAMFGARGRMLPVRSK